jgi:hypothetical protein
MLAYWLNKMQDLKEKKCRIIKKKLKSKLLHLRTVLADVKRDAFTTVKMSSQM